MKNVLASIRLTKSIHFEEITCIFIGFLSKSKRPPNVTVLVLLWFSYITGIVNISWICFVGSNFVSFNGLKRTDTCEKNF